MGESDKNLNDVIKKMGDAVVKLGILETKLGEVIDKPVDQNVVRYDTPVVLNFVTGDCIAHADPGNDKVYNLGCDKGAMNRPQARILVEKPAN